MGNVIYFPIKREQRSYTDSTKCASTGKRLSTYMKVGPLNAFEEITEKFFADLLFKRQDVLRAKLKIKEMDMQAIRGKYPLWSYEDLMDLKAQFQTFDINQDGLIDFQELCSVLEEIGDESPESMRRELFLEMDEDDSGGIDFEEYLTLLHTLTKGQSALMPASECLGVLRHEGTLNAQRVRKLSVSQQIKNGLF